MPITSNGIIAYRKVQNEIELLMICRKDSLGYLDFMRGRFSVHQKGYIMNMIKQMTSIEKTRLLETSHFKDDRIQMLMQGVTVAGEYYDLKSLINESRQLEKDWEEPEWGFPKGRRNIGESDYDCAVREFCEETGYSSSHLQNITNMVPLEEVFTGSNHNSYRHKYYLMYMKDEPQRVHQYQKNEVSRMEWFSIPRCLDIIRPYNIEKKRMVCHLAECLSLTQFVQL